MKKFLFLLKVTLDNNKLMWGQRNTIELIPEDEHTFVMAGREYYRVRFEREKSDAVTQLRVIEFPGVEYFAIKIK